MDKINTKVQIGILRDLYKRNLLTKLQLDKAIEIVVRKEAIQVETDKSSGVLPS